MIAILRVYNPNIKSDIFYKLFSDCYRLCFRVKSWKGRVRRNSFVDVIINTNVVKANSSDNYKHHKNMDNYSPCLTLGQLCQTKFTLEMTEFIPKWRNYDNSLGGGHNRNEQSLLIKIELQCVTFDLLMKMQKESPIDCETIESANGMSNGSIEPNNYLDSDESMSNVSLMKQPKYICEKTQAFMSEMTRDIASKSGQSNTVAGRGGGGGIGGDDDKLVNNMTVEQLDKETKSPAQHSNAIVALIRSILQRIRVTCSQCVARIKNSLCHIVWSKSILAVKKEDRHPAMYLNPIS